MRTLNFENLVEVFYQPLYRFALSLVRKESDACDLTQQTFYVWAERGHQLEDQAKVKTWLFTTLYRQFLQMQRKQNRFPHHELDEVSSELPNLAPELLSRLDALTVVDLLEKIDPVFRAPLALFYLDDHSYREIAEILGIPLGTVKSRIARAIGQLQALLMNSTHSNDAIKTGIL